MCPDLPTERRKTALRRRDHRVTGLVLTGTTSVADDASAVLAEVADELAGAGAWLITDRTPRTFQEATRRSRSPDTWGQGSRASAHRSVGWLPLTVNR